MLPTTQIFHRYFAPSSTSTTFYVSMILIGLFTMTLLNNVGRVDSRVYRRSPKHLGVCRREFLRPLEKRAFDAELVFTGNVERVYKAHAQHHHYRGVVRVKRVVKGSKSYQGNRVVVEGFGSQKICVSDVKEDDTRIFLTNPTHHGRMKLNSSLIRVNRKNVRKAISAAKCKRMLEKKRMFRAVPRDMRTLEQQRFFSASALC